MNINEEKRMLNQGVVLMFPVKPKEESCGATWGRGNVCVRPHNHLPPCSVFAIEGERKAGV
jgi:hypothetical protein